MMFRQKIDDYIDTLTNNFESISQNRKLEIEKLSEIICGELSEHQLCNVVFICTHNSRRSQIAELLFRIGIRYHQIRGLHGYSGGTEATAFNPSAVNACRNKNIPVIKLDGSIANHTYVTSYKYNLDVILQFSKNTMTITIQKIIWSPLWFVIMQLTIVLLYLLLLPDII